MTISQLLSRRGFQRSSGAIKHKICEIVRVFPSLRPSAGSWDKDVVDVWLDDTLGNPGDVWTPYVHFRGCRYPPASGVVPARLPVARTGLFTSHTAHGKRTRLSRPELAHGRGLQAVSARGNRPG
jgi:hypothetical protein